MLHFHLSFTVLNADLSFNIMRHASDRFQAQALARMQVILYYDTQRRIL